MENRYRTEAREIRSEVSQWPENGRQGPWTEAVAVGIKIKGWAENHFLKKQTVGKGKGRMKTRLLRGEEGRLEIWE